MKKIFTLIALGSISLVTADQYYQPYGSGQNTSPSSNNDWGNYSNQTSDDNYSRHYQRHYQRRYLQNDDQRYEQCAPRNNRYQYQERAPLTPSYDQDQYYGQNQYYDQNQYYGQNQYYEQQMSQQLQDKAPKKIDEKELKPKQDDKPVVLSDQEIKQKIKETLSSVLFSKGFQNVTYDVNYGNVDLKGSVNTLEDKHRIEDSVKKINGVRLVNNQLTVPK